MNRKPVVESAIIIAVFFFAFYGRKWISSTIAAPDLTLFWKVAFFYAWWVIPTLITIGLLYGFKGILREIGIERGFLTGLIFSAFVTLPMFVSSALIGQIDDSLSLASLFHETLLAGFMEEYFFRGFLFGLLFRKAGWGFIPAGVSGAFLFGLGHIYQGSTFAETLGVFIVTAMGALWFAWLYIEWNENLWIPIFLHGFMNLSWGLFEVSQNALGGWYTNFFRMITIAVSIVVTIRYHRKCGLRIRRRTLFYGFQSMAAERK